MHYTFTLQLYSSMSWGPCRENNVWGLSLGCFLPPADRAERPALGQTQKASFNPAVQTGSSLWLTHMKTTQIWTEKRHNATVLLFTTLVTKNTDDPWAESWEKCNCLENHSSLQRFIYFYNWDKSPPLTQSPSRPFLVWLMSWHRAPNTEHCSPPSAYPFEKKKVHKYLFQAAAGVHWLNKANKIKKRKRRDFTALLSLYLFLSTSPHLPRSDRGHCFSSPQDVSFCRSLARTGTHSECSTNMGRLWRQRVLVRWKGMPGLLPSSSTNSFQHVYSALVFQRDLVHLSLMPPWKIAPAQQLQEVNGH